MDFSFGFIPDLLRGKNVGDSLKDNVKQGALAGLAMFGLPALGAAAPATGATNAALIDSAVGTAGYGASSATPAAGGLMAGMKDAMGYVKPIGEAAGAAQSVGGLLSGPQVQAPQPQGINPQGAQTLAQLAQQGQVNPEELMKMRRQTMWG